MRKKKLSNFAIKVSYASVELLEPSSQKTETFESLEIWNVQAKRKKKIAFTSKIRLCSSPACLKVKKNNNQE